MSGMVCQFELLIPDKDGMRESPIPLAAFGLLHLLYLLLILLDRPNESSFFLKQRFFVVQDNWTDFISSIGGFTPFLNVLCKVSVCEKRLKAQAQPMLARTLYC